MARQDHSAITDEQRDEFLEQLAEGKSIIDAAGNESLRRKLYRLKDSDPDFAASWTRAYREGTDALVKEAQRRATEGVDRKSFDKDGNLVRHEIVYSDTLLMFLIKQRDHSYRDRVAIDGGDGPPVKIEVELGGSTRDVLRGLVDAGVVQPGAAAAPDTAR